MHSPSSHLHRRFFPVTLIVAAVVGAALIGFGIYGLAHEPVPSPAPASHPTDRVAANPARATTAAARVPILPKTADPVKYARAVARTIMTWNTMSVLAPRDYVTTLVADADPTGYETPGLVTDLASYLPSEATWRQLRTYRTTQSVTIQSATIPPSWPDIVAASGSQLGKGAIAVTIRGTRHRDGSWDGQAQHTDHQVAFTVFLRCAPAYDRCHLLRLSQLNNPLE